MKPDGMTRLLSSIEVQHIEGVMEGLRLHFHEWSEGRLNEHELVSFAYYEGCGGDECCGEILGRAAALAVGKALVENNGCEWVMVQVDEEWRYGVLHKELKLKIDLEQLADGEFVHEDCSLDEPFHAGEAANASYETIVGMIEKGKLMTLRKK